MKSKNIEEYLKWKKSLSYSLVLDAKRTIQYQAGHFSMNVVALYVLCLFEKNYMPIHFDSQSSSNNFQAALQNFNRKIGLDDKTSVFDVTSGRMGWYIQNHRPEVYAEFIQELQHKQLAKPCYVENVKLSLLLEEKQMSLTFSSKPIKDYFLDQRKEMPLFFSNQSGMPETILYMKTIIEKEKTTGDLIIKFPTNELLLTFRELFWRTVDTIGAIENAARQFRIHKQHTHHSHWEMWMSYCAIKNKPYCAFFPPLLPPMLEQLISDYAQHHCEDPDEVCEGPPTGRQCSIM